jgi:ABC-type multidrug transport system fused ATPase/permease subunit
MYNNELISYSIGFFMPRVPSKKPAKRRVKAVVSAGRILEIRPVNENRLRPGVTPSLAVLLLVSIGSIAVAAFAFQKLAAVMGYADQTANQLATVRQEAADLKDRVANFETLRLLAAKTAVSTTPESALPANLVWLDYASKNISLQYPQGFTLLKATSVYPALVIKNDAGRIEIFRTKDFPGGTRPGGCVTDGYLTDQRELGKPSPVECRTVATYDVWIYYPSDDKVTKAILDQIASTIKVLR